MLLRHVRPPSGGRTKHPAICPVRQLADGNHAKSPPDCLKSIVTHPPRCSLKHFLKVTPSTPPSMLAKFFVSCFNGWSTNFTEGTTMNSKYCSECQRAFPHDSKRWGEAEAHCYCGARCCGNHWLSRGSRVPITDENGMCVRCDYEAYKGTYGGM